MHGLASVDVNAGEALWIPAGWVHHVASGGAPSGASLMGTAGSAGGVRSSSDGGGSSSGEPRGEGAQPGYVAALSVTANAPELGAFTLWLTGDGAIALPDDGCGRAP